MASSGAGSKRKGSSYERAIAKKFSAWWGGTFARTPGSGSLHWGSDQRVAGDIIAPQGMDFPFVIEAKKREGWLMEHVLLDIGDPRQWWAQVVGDARRVGLVPILVFSKNRAKDFVMLPYDSWLYGRLLFLGNDHMRTTVTIKNVRDEIQKFDVIVTTFDTLSKISPDDLRDYANSVEWDAYAEDYK